MVAKENSFDGIVFVEATDNSISLVEFNNGKMNGLGIQIKDNRFVAGSKKTSYSLMKCCSSRHQFR